MGVSLSLDFKQRLNKGSGVFRMCEKRGPRGARGKAQVGGLGDEVPQKLQKLTLFVTECLNFDVLEEKISKTAKNTIIKNYGRLKGRAHAQGPPTPLNTPLNKGQGHSFWYRSIPSI